MIPDKCIAHVRWHDAKDHHVTDFVTLVVVDARGGGAIEAGAAAARAARIHASSFPHCAMVTSILQDAGNTTMTPGQSVHADGEPCREWFSSLLRGGDAKKQQQRDALGLAAVFALRMAVLPAWPNGGVHVVRLLPAAKRREGVEDTSEAWSTSRTALRAETVLGSRPDLSLVSWDEAPTPLDRSELGGSTAHVLAAGWGVPVEVFDGWSDALSENWIRAFRDTVKEWPVGRQAHGRLSTVAEQAWSTQHPAQFPGPNAEVSQVSRGLICHAPPPHAIAWSVRTSILERAVSAVEEAEVSEVSEITAVDDTILDVLPRCCAMLAWLSSSPSSAQGVRGGGGGGNPCGGPIGRLVGSGAGGAEAHPRHVRIQCAAHLKDGMRSSAPALWNNLPILAATARQCAEIFAPAKPEIVLVVSVEEDAPEGTVETIERRAGHLAGARTVIVPNDVATVDFGKHAAAFEKHPLESGGVALLLNDSFVLRRPIADLVAAFPFSLEADAPAAFYGLTGSFFLQPHTQSYARVVNPAASRQLVEAVTSFRRLVVENDLDVTGYVPVIQALEVRPPGDCRLWSAYYVPRLLHDKPSHMPEPAYDVWTLKPLVERANYPVVKTKLAAFAPEGANRHLEVHSEAPSSARGLRRWFALPTPQAVIRRLNPTMSVPRISSAPPRKLQLGRTPCVGQESSAKSPTPPPQLPFDFLSEALPVGALHALAGVSPLEIWATSPPRCDDGVEIEDGGHRSAGRKASSSLPCLGSWCRDEARVDELAASWLAADPFPHVVIDEFLQPDIAEAAARDFPEPWDSPDGWCVYNNPIERKFASNAIDRFPSSIRAIFRDLQTDSFLRVIRRVCGIDELENDPTLHGAGMHVSPDGGKLDMHLDYSVHPLLKKERRVNLILYLNREWNPAWGGELELRQPLNSAPGPLGAKVFCGFNRAAIFRTSDLSFHGFPHPIRCPEGHERRSLAIYYLSDIRPGTTPRLKARFFGHPDHLDEEMQTGKHQGLEALRSIRMERILSSKDLEEHAPWFHADDWEPALRFARAKSF